MVASAFQTKDPADSRRAAAASANANLRIFPSFNLTAGHPPRMPAVETVIIAQPPGHATKRDDAGRGSQGRCGHVDTLGTLRFAAGSLAHGRLGFRRACGFSFHGLAIAETVDIGLQPVD